VYGKLSGKKGAMYEQGIIRYVIFFCGKGNENNRMGIGFLTHHRIASAGKRVQFVSDRIVYSSERSLV